ncbi:potassium channel family protein [Candidatus Alkanophaga liquidiphilum]|nr:Trk/Ktr K+ transport system regulatory component TrkA/KtrA/KtrC [Candidatus Alkanophaga liquidiphilum]RLG36988.1 MAG: potassium transporter [Candidatus Alkanophagales archaeon]
MHIIIVGLGGIGRNLVRVAVQDKNDVVVIDKDERRCREVAMEYDVITIVGDATVGTTLEEAGASRADALITTTSDDATNLMITLKAKEFGIKGIVSVVNKEEHLKMFRDAGVTVFENPDMLVAKQLYFASRRPKVKDFLVSIGDGQAEGFELVVEENSIAAGKSLSELKLKDAVVVAVQRNGELIIPKGDTVLRVGDTVTIFARPKYVEKICSLFFSR